MATSSRSNPEARAKRKANEVGSPLQKHFAMLQREDVALYAGIIEQFQHQSLQLIPKLQRRRLRKFAEVAIDAWHKSNLAADGDAHRAAKRKLAIRGELDRVFARLGKPWRQWEKARQAFQKNYANAAKISFRKAMLAQAPLGWGIALPVPPQLKAFLPPYPLVEVTVNDYAGSGFIRSNKTAAAVSGLLVNDVELRDDEHAGFLTGLFSWQHADIQAACGIEYKVLRAGRLYVRAELQNLYNFGTLSLRDNFGFSSGDLKVSINLNITIVRENGEVIHLPKILFTDKLTEDGEDSFSLLPDLEPLYTWDRLAEASFYRDEVLKIHVGVMVHTNSVLDDMHSHVRVLLAWSLKRISVGVQ